MLIPDFYTVQQFNASENQIFAKLLLNKEHKIYKGHFPDQPVVPGVVQLQIVREMVGKATGKEMFLDEIGSAKYLNMINPLLFEKIDIEINFQRVGADGFKIDARILNDNMIFLKLKAHLKSRNPD